MTRFLYGGMAGILAFFVLSGCANPLTAPLIDASREGNAAEVQKLLSEGAPIEASGGKWDDSPLATAAGYGHLKVVKLLLKHGADPNKLDGEGGTPLEALASSNYPHWVISGWPDPSIRPPNIGLGIDSLCRGTTAYPRSSLAICLKPNIP